MRVANSILRWSKKPRKVGSVLPSSRYLARALAGDLRLLPGEVVVEYGPGTGPMTEVIHGQLQDPNDYLGIERNGPFHARLTERFPDLRFHLGSVEAVEKIVAENDLAKPKVIISGLPFASLPIAVQKRVIVATRRVLRDDGEFRTFQYVHAWSLPAAQSFRRAMAQR